MYYIYWNVVFLFTSAMSKGFLCVIQNYSLQILLFAGCSLPQWSVGSCSLLSKLERVVQGPAMCLTGEN